MQDPLVDKKIKVLYDNYRDSLYAKNAQQEVEAMRRKATYTGAGITAAAFIGNEVARLTLRSPLFKLKVQNVALVLFLPTYLTKRAYGDDVEKRLANMWRTHKNRVDRGLGSTYKAHGVHESMRQGAEFHIPNFHWSASQLIAGTFEDAYFDNVFARWHESYEKYPSFLGDLDDHALYQTDEFERFKKFKARKKDVVGATPALVREDNDEKWEYYDIQGESLYSHPPDPNSITVDHGLDEDTIWCFPKTAYNQDVVENPYTVAFSPSLHLSHAPQWGQKLSQPHFYKPEKMKKFHRHWQHRLGLEAIKLRQAAQSGAWPTEASKAANDAEISKYVESCYQYEKDKQLEDVYVTDHQAVAKKHLTHSEEEDQDFYDYEKAVAEYNSDGAAKTLEGAGSSKYARGSLMQKIVDPFAGAPRDEDGAVVYTVTDEELAGLKLDDEEYLKGLHQRLTAAADVWDVDPEDDDAWRTALVDDLSEDNSPFQIEEFHAVLDKELAIFKQGEKYDFVKDLKEAYKDTLQIPIEQQIFKTIPDHAFWDIKKPLQDGGHKRENRYNTFRGREYRDFFEMRDAEEVLDQGNQQRNLNNSVSKHQQY